MAKPCLGCGTLIHRGGGSRCPSCQADHNRAANRAAIRRGPRPWYGPAFQAARKAALLATPYCVRCGTCVDLTVDHVAPRSAAAGYQVLCRRCNAAKGGRVKKSGGRGV